MRANSQLLTVIRHGKRLDEVQELWRENSVRPWDPPLWRDGLASVSLPDDDILSHFLEISRGPDVPDLSLFLTVWFEWISRFNRFPCMWDVA